MGDYTGFLGLYRPTDDEEDWGPEFRTYYANLVAALCEQMMKGNGLLTGGEITAGAGALQVNVAASKALIDGTLRERSAASDQNLTDDAFNIIYQDAAGTLTIATAIPSGAHFTILGSVPCASGARVHIKNFPNDLFANLIRTAGADFKLNADKGTDGAAADATFSVERGVTGADANLKWNEATGRMQAGLAGSEQNIVLPGTADNLTNKTTIVVGHSATLAIGGVSPSLQVHRSNGSDQLGIVRWSGNNYGPWFILGMARSTNIGTCTIVQDNDSLGQIVWAGADGGDLNTTGARIEGRIDGTPAADRMPTELVFYTALGAGDNDVTENALLDKNGNWILHSGYLELAEISAPTGAASKARIYALDDGSKTDLLAFFQSGVGVKFAEEV